MNLRGLSVKYNRLYKEADKLFKEYNPCQFKDSSCVQDRRDGGIGKNGCCYSCEYLGPDGCKVKAIGCKLFFCWEAAEKNKEFTEKLTQVKIQAEGILGNTSCHQTKDQYMDMVGERTTSIPES